MPYAPFEARRRALFKRLAENPEGATDVFARVRSYNKMSPGAETPVMQAIRSIPRKKSYYYFDLKIDAKHFGPSLRLGHRFGDVTKVPPTPTIVKSRPIREDNTNSVLMKLDRLRHFDMPPDERRFEDKQPFAVWRGTQNNPARKLLAERYASHVDHDIGFSESRSAHLNKRFLSVRDQLAFRYVVSIEGNDVATNLKWIMASKSICMMPRPRFETWFLEGQLQPDVHYVELRDDFGDLDDRIAYCEANPEMMRSIIANANRYVEQFKDESRERLASLLVLQKYFECTGQIEPEPFSPRLYSDDDWA
ncbi:lipopolysaccharide biosynthesis protein [Aquibium carbonis]|uniref:Lipopolysaccharide biosynthesis protein n=2 Tax=Aquibium carbonis TaxID=2495581 RepID=A0A3R9YHU2_9HYPH|nr:lipopolysaccharide biosynthesis protein [Aquibium carbonis]